MNILVGPNNSGKSTIISAFRTLNVGIRLARAKSPTRVMGPSGETLGYSLPSEDLPISMENVHTNYSDEDGTITFRISNGKRLQLYFPKDGGCFLLTAVDGAPVRTPSAFRSSFPITIQIVPILGPVEHNEVFVSEETVRKGLTTHRASRHFRNFWHYNPEKFSEFSDLIKKTWPGMEIQKPERADTNKLAMFCLENRISRELYWSGFGFQIWCQLLTHISRSEDSTMIVVDEPEVYLHPDIQRQLLSILRETNADILLATHSTEIMGEADPAEILLVDKSKRSAERLRDVEGVQKAMSAMGSVQNITLTRLARTKKLLFLEGMEDYTLIRRFAKRVGLHELASGTDITASESGGFSSWSKICTLAWGFETALESRLHLGAIFDRDYWCDEEIAQIQAELAKHLELGHIHARKEMENYLLVPDVLQRAFEKALEDRLRRGSEPKGDVEPISEILLRITKTVKSEIQAQYIAKRIAFFKKTGKDDATITAQAITIFDSKWDKLETRLEIVPGKDTLRKLREHLQIKYQISLTDFRIIDEFKKEEIPNDLIKLLSLIEAYRKQEMPRPKSKMDLLPTTHPITAPV